MVRNIIRDVPSSFSGRVAVFAITFFGTPLLVRALGGSAAFGDYMFLMSGFALLMIVISSGVTDGVQEFVGERDRYHRRKDHIVGFYIRFAFALALLGAVGVAAVAYSGIVTRLFGPDYDVYLVVLAALVITAPFRELVVRLLHGLGHEKYSERLRGLDTAVWAFGGILLAWVGLGVTGVLVAHVLAGLLVTVIGLSIVASHIDLTKTFSRTPDRLPVGDLLSFNVLSVALVLFMTTLYEIDIIMIRTFLTDDLTGQYAAALALSEYLWFVPLAIQGMFVHSSSNPWSKHRTTQLTDVASKTTRYTVLFTALLALGVAALAHQFIPLYYGPGFTEAVLPLLILLPGVVALAVARPIYAIGKEKGELRPLVAATGVAAVVNALLNFVLIPRFGIVGAAIATSIGYGLLFPLHVLTARHIGFDPLDDLRPIRIIVTTLVAAVPIFILSRAIAGHLALVVVPVAGALSFGLIAIATRAVTMPELLEIGGHFPDPIGRVARTLRGRMTDRSAPASLPSILTVIGILLFVGGIVLSLSGAIGPGAPGPIGGSATDDDTTTTDVEAEDPMNPDDTQQAGDEDDTTPQDTTDTTENPGTTTETTEETTEDTSTTTDDQTTTTEDSTTTTTEEPTSTTTSEDPTTTTTTSEDPTTTTTSTTTTTTTTTTSTTTTTEEETTTTDEQTTTEDTTTTTTSTTTTIEEPTPTTTEEEETTTTEEETTTTEEETTTTEETTAMTPTTSTTTTDDDDPSFSSS